MTRSGRLALASALGCLVSLSVAPAAFAAADRPLLGGPIADHAVLQRGATVPLSGRAQPDVDVRVRFGRWSTVVRAGHDGRWAAALPPQKPGGPYALLISAGAQSLRIADLLVGDVFLCSGQSNMEFAVRQAQDADRTIANAADSGLRLMKIAQNPQPAPLADFAQTPTWRAAAPDSVADFSAACLFMGQALRQYAPVPIGLVTGAVGGSAIQTWMSARANLDSGADRDRVALLALAASDPDAANAHWGALWEHWWKQTAGVLQGMPWRDDPAAAEWLAEPPGDMWSSWNVPQLKAYQGMIWFRREIILTGDQAKDGAVLDLGRMRLIDQVWVNGTPIANSFGWDLPRRYRVPAHLLTTGRNIVTVALASPWGVGGFLDPASRALALANGARLPLADGWTYRAMSPTAVGEPPRSPWDAAAGVDILYNGMIAPLGSYPFKAIAWYQGEAHVSAPSGYARLLRAMMADWRSQFGAKTPFLVVQIANFGPDQTPADYSGAARVRDEQRRAVIDDGNSRLIVTIDIGNPADIHPINKQDVGRRLALALLDLDRPGRLPALTAPTVSRDGRTISIGFARDMRLKTTNMPIAPFTMCGPASAQCQAVDATLQDDGITIDTGGVAATVVRYCWADSLRCTLRDQADLPVSPFEVDLAPTAPRMEKHPK